MPIEDTKPLTDTKEPAVPTSAVLPRQVLGGNPSRFQIRLFQLGLVLIAASSFVAIVSVTNPMLDISNSDYIQLSDVSMPTHGWMALGVAVALSIVIIAVMLKKRFNMRYAFNILLALGILSIPALAFNPSYTSSAEKSEAIASWLSENHGLTAYHDDDVKKLYTNIETDKIIPFVDESDNLIFGGFKSDGSKFIFISSIPSSEKVN